MNTEEQIIDQSPDNTTDQAARGLSVHGGFPNPATDKRLQALDLNQLLITRPTSTFIFRIRGEQGNASGIFDGDVAIVDRALTPRAYDLVLWHNGQHFTVSRPARIASGASVWGVVTATIHQHRSQ